MVFYKFKGKRIRASNKTLVYRFFAGTVANASFQGADVDWFIEADDIILKGKNSQSAGNPQNNNQQGQPKK